MNVVLSAFERIAIGPEEKVLDRELLDFRNGHVFTVRSAMEALLVLASVGKGKSTLARTIYRALLRERFGGLVLCVKRSQIQEFLAQANLEGRHNDCIVLSSGGTHAFNPLAGEQNPSEAAALVSELAEVLADRVRDGGENEAFWRSQLLIILRNLFTLCQTAYGRLDFLLAAELFDARANSTAEVSDPSWRQISPMARAIALTRRAIDDSNTRLAVDYFERTFPAQGDRLQGSLAATVGSVLDYLRRPPLSGLFAGESTFSMEDLLDNGKIAIVGLPALDSVDGKIANALMQYCFCRAATRRSARGFSFIAADECQETVSREFMRKLAVLREYQVASVLLTQNLAVLDEKLGETAREGLCGLMGTKIFGPQGHAATRQWAADQIGKRKVPVKTKSSGSSGGVSNHSKSEHQVWDYRVPPSRFAELEVGQTVCLRDSEVWLSRWHRDRPGKSGTVRIVD